MVQNTNKYVYAFWSRTPDKQHGNALYPWISDEKNFGRVKYLITYFICGIAGGIISSGIEMITGEYSMRAGLRDNFGIFGVLLVMIFKSRKQLGQVSAPRLILLFILMVFGNMQEGVDWMAHGRAVTGSCYCMAIYRPGNKPLHL